DGESVVPLIEGGRRSDPPPSYAETFYPRWHYGWSELKAVRVGGWKYIDAPKPELYDMKADGGEATNLVESRQSLAGGLAGQLAKRGPAVGAAGTVEAPRPNADTLARLRSLGYVGVAAPSSARGARGIDPKDHIADAEALRAGISRAMDALGRNQPDAAIADLQRLIKTNERSYELHLFLGD